MMRRSHFGSTPITRQQALTQLNIDLVNMPDDRLFALTVLDLKPRYKLSAREIECVLLAKQDTRRRFLATGAITA